MKRGKSVQKVENGIEETLRDLYGFSHTALNPDPNHNTIEPLNREIKRRTKAIVAFPDGQSAPMLVCARLRHVVATSWGARHYMNMEHLFKGKYDLLSDIIAG